MKHLGIFIVIGSQQILLISLSVPVFKLVHRQKSRKISQISKEINYNNENKIFKYSAVNTINFENKPKSNKQAIYKSSLQ